MTTNLKYILRSTVSNHSTKRRHYAQKIKFDKSKIKAKAVENSFHENIQDSHSLEISTCSW